MNTNSRVNGAMCNHILHFKGTDQLLGVTFYYWLHKSDILLIYVKLSNVNQNYLANFL